MDAAERPTYASVAKRPPPVLGRPKVSLPTSQLTLWRTTPPWFADSWKLASCDIDDETDVLRVHFPAGCCSWAGSAFLGAPRCLPATDVIVEYRVRFAPTFDWKLGGRLPGLCIGHPRDSTLCCPVWQGRGAVACVSRGRGGQRTMLDAAQLQWGRERWNKVVLRLKLNGFDDFRRPLRDGTLSLSIDGKAATMSGVVWRTAPDALITRLAFETNFFGAWTMPVSTHIDFTGFGIVA